MDVSDSMLRSPSKSLRKLAQEKDIALATAHKAVREKLNLFPYKVTAVQELKPADHEVHSDFPNALYVTCRVLGLATCSGVVLYKCMVRNVGG
jgi:hypothetical protein